MARGVNKVILIGNVGNDPEVRAMPNGDCVSTLSVATSESWKDKQTGEQKERTEWHRIVVHRRLAEIVRDYVTKGSKLYVEGSLRTRKWKDKEGKEHYTTEIIGAQIQMLDSRQRDDAGYAEPSQPAGGSHSAPEGEFDDDIPF